MLRYRRGDEYGLLVLRYWHHDLARMQLQGRPALAWRSSIDVVADDRKTELGAMHPELMGAAGQRFEREPGQALAASHDFPGRRRRLALRVGLHPPAAG